MKALLYGVPRAYLNLVEEIFSELGYDFDLARDPEEAWRLYRQGSHPLVLLASTARKEELALCRRIRDWDPGVPRVILAVVDGVYRDRPEEILAMGADDYLLAPLEAGRLRARVHLADRRLRSGAAPRESAPFYEGPEFFRLLVETMYEGLGVRDAAGRIVYVNPRLCEMLGYEPQEMLGRPVTAFLDEASKRRFEAELEQRPRGAGSSYESTMLRKDGRPIFTLQAGREILDRDGTFQGSFAVITDVTSLKEAEAALRESEERYRTIFEQGPLAITLVDLDYRYIKVNARMCELVGYTEDELYQLTFADVTYPEDIDIDVELADKVFRGEIPFYQIEKRYVRKDGGIVWGRLTATVVRNDRGEPIYGLGLVEDITERKRAEEALRISEERFRSLVQNASDLVAIVDTDGTILYESPSHRRVLGFDPAARQGRSAFDHLHPGDRPRVAAAFQEVASVPGRSIKVEYRIRHADGTWRVLESFGTNLIHNPAVQGIVVNSRDITDRKRAEEQLLHDALHDALTGLPNRALFMDRLNQSLGRAARIPGGRCAVLFLDLDRFKVINDSLSHAMGDLLLTQLSQRLKSLIRPSDTLARLGGDEFAVLIEGLGEAAVASAVRLAERIHQALEIPFDLEGQQIYTTASVGIALSSPDKGQAEELLRDADTAMYRAKTVGRGQYVIFDAEMHTVVLAQLQMETDLRRALDEWRFEVHYQPIVALETATIVGFEALVRWRRSDGVLVLPDEFIPTVEETGLIHALSRKVLEEACRTVGEWQDRALSESPIFVTVNLSTRQFSQPDLGGLIEEILRETGLDPESLVLELTESATMENPDVVWSVLQRIRDLGVHLSLDDFGTGFSSLSVLHRFPFDMVKIAGTLVEGVGADRRSTHFLEGILTLFNREALVTVAEGVETSLQRDKLRQIGCPYGQGFLFAPPLPAEKARKLLRQKRLP